MHAPGEEVLLHMGLALVGYGPCSNVLISSNLIVCFSHFLKVPSLIGNKAKLVISISGLQYMLLLISLYASWINFHHEANGLPPLALLFCVMEVHRCMHMASTTRLFSGDKATQPPDKKLLT